MVGGGCCCCSLVWLALANIDETILSRFTPPPTISMPWLIAWAILFGKLSDDVLIWINLFTIAGLSMNAWMSTSDESVTRPGEDVTYED